MLETILEVSYFAAGVAARDVDTWQLQPAESKDLASATEAFLKTLPAAKTKRILANIEKYAPGFSLAFTAGVITIPRVMVTYKKYKNGQARKIPVTRNGSTNGDPGQPVASGAESAPSPVDQWANLDGATRPLTADDIAKNG